MKRIFIGIINVYQKYISPILGKHCRYYPTCSEYTKQAIKKYGIFKGTFYGIKRVMKCNPFSKGGYDPLK
ncbi:MAG: membrane protein insertion efficiency factor YidD [Clostridia bacterium]|nr:membrane protein insertion efficiency factor YidD [Clostridia bacterium]